MVRCFRLCSFVVVQDQKLGKLAIDPAAARDFERPMKMKPENQTEHASGNKPTPEEMQNPQV